MNARNSLTVNDIARVLEVSPSTVYRLIKVGELPAFRINQRQVQVRQQDLVAYIESHRVSKALRIKDADSGEGYKNQAVTQSGLEKIKQKGHTDSETKILTRRRFLQGSFSLVLVAAANLVGGLGATLIYEGFAHEVEEQRQLQLLEQQRLGLIAQLFGGLFNFSWSAGLTHLVQDYGITRFQQSSNVIASISLGSMLGLQGYDWLAKAIYTEDLPGPIRVDGDIIVVGSPTSDMIAKACFEYHGTRYELKRTTEPLIDLPITYILDKNELGGEDVLLRRYVAGEEKEIYNWGLRMENEILPPPKLDARHWLQTDYLLITRVPNLVSRKAFFEGAEVLMIGGTHGTGTEAIDLLLKDVKLLSRIQAERQNSAYYQVLIPIIKIIHHFDGERGRTFPVQLGDPITKPISVDIDRMLSIWNAVNG